MRIPKLSVTEWTALLTLVATVGSILVMVFQPEIRNWIEPPTDDSFDSPSARVVPLNGYNSALLVQVSECEAMFDSVLCHLQIRNQLRTDQTVSLGTEGSFAVNARGVSYPAGWVTLGSTTNPSHTTTLLPPGISLAGSISFSRMSATRGEVISRLRVGVEVDSVHLLEFTDVLIR